jgi:hypothetical protein
LTKFAFDNIIEISQKSSLFSFYFPIQNLLEILSWSLNKSCRELNFKQLSFLGHFQKISFSCSKISLKLLHFENLEKELKNKKKKLGFSFVGRRLAFGPLAKAGPDPRARARNRSLARALPRPSSLPRPSPRRTPPLSSPARDARSDRAQMLVAAWRPHAGAASHVDDGDTTRRTSRRHTRVSASTPLLARSLSHSLWRNRAGGAACRNSPPPPPPRSDAGEPPPSD